ncbi:hypothetical protein KCU81_g588, partial [Aureobasidium melanogenum]
MRLVRIRGKGSSSGLRSRHVITGLVVVVDVVVGTVQRARQISLRLGPLDTDDSGAARWVRRKRPAHSTNERLQDSLCNGQKESCRDLTRTEQTA